jgi:hypothetical protein
MTKKADFTEVAYRVFQKATRLEKPSGEAPLSPKAAAGQKGGRRGGKARAAALTKKMRQEIARQAAIKRWSGRPKPSKTK